jgi:hypothetical protein
VITKSTQKRSCVYKVIAECFFFSEMHDEFLELECQNHCGDEKDLDNEEVDENYTN